MSVLIEAAYDEQSVPNVKNAAWNGMFTVETIGVCLSAGHKTTKNILATHAFTVNMATVDQMVVCDYAGIVSGNKVPDKFVRAGFHATSSTHVNAPMIDEQPKTLLCEHYRCHPKIINFSNQPTPGHHARGAFNPREIETIRREVLPSLPYEQAKIGIISPYNEQVNALHRELGGGIDVATVHKFQGREKEAIILSTVDNQITAFTDDPNLLNVAVSRAKRQFTLVTSSNEQPDSRNIADLLAYIDYNGGKITESAIHSVFDLLYEPYAEARREFLKRHRRISEFDSENLTYALLERVLETDPAFRHLGVLCHQPLRQLIRDWTLLNDEECRYASNGATHLDFLIYNRVSKRPVLAVETDGYQFHKQGTRQSERDRMKDRILDRYSLPLLRLSTTGTDEEAKIKDQLSKIVE